MQSASSDSGSVPEHLCRRGGTGVGQRRRFWRATLRESSTVELTVPGATDGYRGAMLNVSPDGLACTVRRCDADELCDGDRIKVRFNLEGETESFQSVMELKGKTPAGSPAQVILRMQFVPAAMTEQLRLRIDRATRSYVATA